MKKIIIFLFFFAVIVLLCSCVKEDTAELSEKYFQGLDSLAAEKKEEAIAFFLEAKGKNFDTISFFALEQLLPLLYEKKNFSQMLELTQDYFNTNLEEYKNYYTTEKNFVTHFQILAMLQQNNKEVSQNIVEWLEGQVFSNEHYQFFTSENFLNYKKENILSQEIIERIEIQAAVFERDYGLAVRTILSSEQYSKDSPNTFFEKRDDFYLSDIGKAVLYGSNDNLFFARSFEKSATTYASKSTEAFMCFFYAGRLFEKSGYSDAAIEAFEKAMSASITEENYDNALWYYVTTIRKLSSRSAITALQEFSSTWHDPTYFDDFLDALAFQLLDNENYKGFYALYDFLVPYISPVSISKYAYISALLLEKDYVNPKSNKETEIKNLYETSYNAMDGSLYYRMMAAVELDISSSRLLNDLLAREDEDEKIFDEKFGNILQELLVRGYTDEVYSLYLENSEIVRLETAVFLAKELSLINSPSIENNFNNNYFPESLRLASRAFSESVKDISSEDMKLLYPLYYTDFVTQTSEVYGLDEFLIYALMRSESFFDHDVMSWAGAIGLTQLMPTTASDVARKLRVKDYDLHNARQNIDFGMYYLDELIPREGVDNSILRALFSYNAGITNVRRWNRQFPELQDNPALFLEKIPFAETREYGRKILSAAVMYGILYYDMEVSDVVQAIMN